MLGEFVLELVAASITIKEESIVHKLLLVVGQETGCIRIIKKKPIRCGGGDDSDDACDQPCQTAMAYLLG